MIIPILLDHNPSKVIGKVEQLDEGFCFTLNEGISRDGMFELFGNSGIRVLESEIVGEEMLITKGIILEYSK